MDNIELQDAFQFFFLEHLTKMTGLYGGKSEYYTEHNNDPGLKFYNLLARCFQNRSTCVCIAKYSIKNISNIEIKTTLKRLVISRKIKSNKTYFFF